MVNRNDFSMTVMTNALLAVFTAITSILIARSFGPEVRGYYAIISSLINFSVMISLFGTPTKLATIYGKRLSVMGPSTLDFAKSFYSVVVISSLFILLGAPFYVSLFLNNNNFFIQSILFSATSILASYSICRLQLNLAEANWAAFNFTRLTFALVVLLLVFLARGEDVGLLEVLACIFFAKFLSVFVQIILSKALPTRGRELVSNVLGLYKSSRHFFFNALAGASSGYADTLCAALVLNPAAVGFWAVARSISALLAPVNSAVSATVFSAYTRGNNDTKIQFRRIVFSYMLFNGISIAFLASAASFLVVPVFGSEFSPSISLVPIALGFGFFASTAELFEERLRGDGRPQLVTVSRGSLVPFYLALYFFGSNELDIETFSLVCLLGQGCRLLLSVIALRKS